MTTEDNMLMLQVMRRTVQQLRWCTGRVYSGLDCGAFWAFASHYTVRLFSIFSCVFGVIETY